MRKEFNSYRRKLREKLESYEGLEEKAALWFHLSKVLAARLYNYNSKDLLFTNGTFAASTLETIKVDATKLKLSEEKHAQSK